MKRIVFGIAAVLLFMSAGTLLAQAPGLYEPVNIYNGDSPLEPDIMSTAEVVDWNNDGKKDLIVGTFTNGYVWRYLNQGTDADPVFDGGAKISSQGSPITTSYG